MDLCIFSMVVVVVGFSIITLFIVRVGSSWDSKYRVAVDTKIRIGVDQYICKQLSILLPLFHLHCCRIFIFLVFRKRWQWWRQTNASHTIGMLRSSPNNILWYGLVPDKHTLTSRLVVQRYPGGYQIICIGKLSSSMLMISPGIGGPVEKYQEIWWWVGRGCGPMYTLGGLGEVGADKWGVVQNRA